MKFTTSGRTYKIDRLYLEKVAVAAFSFLPDKEGEIELLFVSEEKIKELNNVYRNIDKVTDVLSFEISDSPLIGQIFICYNKLIEQAKEFEKSLESEVALLLVHGILHIYGYDHIKDDDYSEMKQKETEILKNF